MPESIIERLSRLTPDGGGLDRDRLLIAVGRASARPKLPWPMVTALLAASQVLTLCILWARLQTAPNLAHDVAITARDSEPPMGDAQVSTRIRRKPGTLLAGDRELPPLVPVDHLVPADPPLQAFASPAQVGLP